MYDLINILKDTAEIDATFQVSSIEQIGGALTFQYKFFACDFKTYWLKPCMTIFVDGAEGNVQLVQNNEWVQIQFDREIDLETKSFTIPHGSFIHGTVPMADVELSFIERGNKSKETYKPMPVIYFQEIYTETILNVDNSNEFTGDNMRIYFLDDYKQNNNWTTQEHYDNIINQMRNYALFFIEKLKEDKRVDYEFIENNTQKIVKRVKTGEYQKGGNTIATFGRNLSGTELILSIAVKRDNRCGGC